MYSDISSGSIRPDRSNKNPSRDTPLATGHEPITAWFWAASQMDQQVQTIALCAGSGASVLKGVKADVYLTGEMSHHDVLDAVSHGIHVILCEHSNTERGFLKVFEEKLKADLEGKV